MSESLSKQCQHLRLICLLPEGKGRKDSAKSVRSNRQKDRRRSFISLPIPCHGSGSITIEKRVASLSVREAMKKCLPCTPPRKELSEANRRNATSSKVSKMGGSPAR